MSYDHNKDISYQMNLYELDIHHTTPGKCYAQKQSTTDTNTSYVHQVKNDDFSKYLENDFAKFVGITSRQTCLLNDHFNMVSPHNVNNSNPVTSKMCDSNKDNNLSKSILEHVKQMQKSTNNNNNEDFITNFDYLYSDASWTKDEFTAKYCTSSSEASPGDFINSTKIRNTSYSVGHELICCKEYQLPSCQHDQHFNSTPAQLYSPADYSVMRTMDYPYIINNEHQHYSSEFVRTSDIDFLNCHNNLHMDTRTNTNDFVSTTGAINSDSHKISEPKVNLSMTFLNDHYSTPSRITSTENIKSYNSLSHSDVFESAWLDRHNTIHSSTNWSADWTNNAESNSQTNYQSYSLENNIPMSFDSFRSLDTSPYISARSVTCKDDYSTTKSNEVVSSSLNLPVNNNHHYDLGPEPCDEFNTSLSPQSEPTKQCNIVSNNNSDVTVGNAYNLPSGAYFWLYNSQCKGPKASPLLNVTSTLVSNNSAEDDQAGLIENCTSNNYQDDFVSSSASPRAIHSIVHYPISPISLPGYPLVVFEDPVQRRYDLVHCSKLRRGDGNDVTPNLMRLRSMGEELAYLNRNITAQGELIAANASTAFDQSDINLDFKMIQDLSGSVFNSKIVEQAKREKNKLASKICRLKKKAFHEANKIKYLGLEIEYNELASVIVRIKELITKTLRDHLPSKYFLHESTNPHQIYASENQLNKVNLSSQSSSSTHIESMLLPQSNVQIYPHTSGSLFKQALIIYETTHVTRTAGRMDILVNEVIQNYSLSCSLSTSGTDLFENGDQSFIINKKFDTPLLQALSNSNVYYNSHDEDKSSDTRSSNAIFHESPEIRISQNIQHNLQQQQCSSTSKLNYPRPPPEFKLIYE
ncbi:hypothetical protein MN116_005108 [Schistosoma mekongi]|uniref:BZIP domain-containing protein n=1 Tax=Schistosoma mekongi TaxID=38744 RepID=A0AAE1ZCW0_SCHME|nr:hypothetical protein MN116_005108 [Schistosoma mekongi]